MKIQIDTESKMIRLEKQIELGTFFKYIKKLLPDGEWREYTLETNTIVNWQNPVVIREIQRERYNDPWITWRDRTYTTMNGGITHGSTYCLEVSR